MSISIAYNQRKQDVNNLYNDTRKKYELGFISRNKEKKIEAIFKYLKMMFHIDFNQCSNLFSKEIKEFEQPIKFKKNTTIADLKYILDELYNVGYIDSNSRFKILERNKVFSHNRSKRKDKILQAETLKNNRYKKDYLSKSKNGFIIRNLFKGLKSL